MGLANLIGNKADCLVPPESRAEQQSHNKGNYKKNSSTNKQTTHKQNKSKRGLTRFSSDQFNDSKNTRGKSNSRKKK